MLHHYEFDEAKQQGTLQQYIRNKVIDEYAFEESDIEEDEELQILVQNNVAILSILLDFNNIPNLDATDDCCFEIVEFIWGAICGDPADFDAIHRIYRVEEFDEAFDLLRERQNSIKIEDWSDKEKELVMNFRNNAAKIFKVVNGY